MAFNKRDLPVLNGPSWATWWVCEIDERDDVIEVLGGTLNGEAAGLLFDFFCASRSLSTILLMNGTRIVRRMGLVERRAAMKERARREEGGLIGRDGGIAQVVRQGGYRMVRPEDEGQK